MTPTDHQFMADNRWAVESYSQSSPPRHMGMRERERLLKIMQENFNPSMKADLWCPECVRSFVINAYQIYDSIQC